MCIVFIEWSLALLANLMAIYSNMNATTVINASKIHNVNVFV